MGIDYLLECVTLHCCEALYALSGFVSQLMPHEGLGLTLSVMPHTTWCTQIETETKMSLEVFSGEVSMLQGHRAETGETAKRPTCLVLLVHRQMIPTLGLPCEHWKVYSADGLLTRSCLVHCAYHCLPEASDAV